MSLIPGFLYDVFISYAHVDNRRSATQAKGWIDQFHSELSLLLIQYFGREANIWYDNTNLDSSTVFDSSIKKGVLNSAIIICINSPSYNNSDYCLKELEFFHTKAINNLVIADRSRIVHVLLNNIPHKTWPGPLAGATGFRFFSSKGQDHLGDRVKVQSVRFEKEMRDLRDSVANLINDMISRQQSGNPIIDELNIEQVEATIAGKAKSHTAQTAEALPGILPVKQEIAVNETASIKDVLTIRETETVPAQPIAEETYPEPVLAKEGQNAADEHIADAAVVEIQNMDTGDKQARTLKHNRQDKPVQWAGIAIFFGIIALLVAIIVWKPWSKASSTTAINKKDTTATVKYTIPDNEKVRGALLHLNQLKDSSNEQQQKAIKDVLDTLFTPGFSVKLRYDNKSALAVPVNGPTYLSDLYSKNQIADILVIKSVSINHRIDSIDIVEVHKNKLDIKTAH